jgi:hypothetical protein
MNDRFNEQEWFSAVYMAKVLLELPENKDFNISLDELKTAAWEYLNGLIERYDGNQPTLSDRTSEISFFLETCAAINNARDGGGLQ